MKYCLSIHEVNGGFRNLKPAEQAAYWSAWDAYSKAIHGAGVFVSGSALEAAETATTVRLKAGKRQIQDGPFVESKEQFAGFIVIEVAALDEALQWAERIPGLTYGASVEVRPLLDVAVCMKQYAEQAQSGSPRQSMSA